MRDSQVQQHSIVLSHSEVELFTNRLDVFRIENVDDDLAAQVLPDNGSVRLPHRLQRLVVLEPVQEKMINLIEFIREDYSS